MQFMSSMFTRCVGTSTFVERVFAHLSAFTRQSCGNSSIEAVATAHVITVFDQAVQRWWRTLPGKRRPARLPESQGVHTCAWHVCVQEHPPPPHRADATWPSDMPILPGCGASLQISRMRNDGSFVQGLDESESKAKVGKSTQRATTRMFLAGRGSCPPLVGGTHASGRCRTMSCAQPLSIRRRASFDILGCTTMTCWSQRTLGSRRRLLCPKLALRANAWQG